MDNLQSLQSEFCKTLNVDWSPPSIYLKTTQDIINRIGFELRVDVSLARRKLFENVNKKFEFNKKPISVFFDFSASLKTYYNYHEKEKIRYCFNANDALSLVDLLKTKGVNEYNIDILQEYFRPISIVETLRMLHSEIRESGKREDILIALFSAFIFNLFPVSKMHEVFNPNSIKEGKYIEDYFDFVSKDVKFKRDVGLGIIKIDQDLFSSFKTKADFFDFLFSYIKYIYDKLSNYCYLAIYISPIKYYENQLQWEIYSKLVLFAEKFVEESLKSGYFHPKVIESVTKTYIKGLDITHANFSISNTGFSYKDCFIIPHKSFKSSTKKDVKLDTTLLLLFEKSKRDETPVPCPTCRSLAVRGNSYPVIGVKSWECHNILCGDKSKFNRGKRYSMASLIKQEAITKSENVIDIKTIRDFQLDVIDPKTEHEITSFIISHYSLYHDRVETLNMPNHAEQILGRSIATTNYKSIKHFKFDFFNSAYFKRFEVMNNDLSITGNEIVIKHLPDIKIYNGDSFQIMKGFSNNSIDGAVTSPPYYNAKSYSQWPNIYCYLYDMLNNAREVFRVLKPGAPYLYNIFDYFDNERNVVLSAMGKKRMILGAYIVHLFSKIGFEIVDNIIWYKGHIQGNRSNNQGNMSPYYQAPLNCYEHVFYFRKPGNDLPKLDFPKIIKVHPVVKIVKGENILGHTAPFPLEIPGLLTSVLPHGSLILDPYAGSFTTAQKCLNDGHRSISIEKSLEYCELGVRLLSKLQKQCAIPFC